MRIHRRAKTLVVLSVLASHPFIPIGRVLAARADGNPPEPAAAFVQPKARLLEALRSKTPIEPIDVKEDPYLIWHGQQPPVAPAGTVCGVRFERDQVHYRLATFTQPEEARTAGFSVTHFGACGTCSTLQDLAVYLETPDLTAPVRKCGFRLSRAASLTCLEDLKFSTACAKTWLYNLQNTRRQCLRVCLSSWIKGEAPTRKDGSLNACLQCDEVRSGLVFKATAGRTRRNSGIRSSIPRPDAEIAPIVHDYVPGLTLR
jgi:hypothetical protein